MLTCRRTATRRIRWISGFRGVGMTQKPAASAQETDQRTDSRRRAALEAPRCAHARQLPHQEPEIEAADVHEQTFQDIGMPAQMHAAHPAGLVEMGVGPFQELAALSQQPVPARAPNATTIRIHRLLGRGLARPVAPPTIRLRHVTPHADLHERLHRLVAVIPVGLEFPILSLNRGPGQRCVAPEF